MLDDESVLLVKSTQSRGLKSVSSARKLPLHALLEKEELDRLRRWAARTYLRLTDKSMAPDRPDPTT